MSLVIYFIPYPYLFVCFIVYCWRHKNQEALIIPGGRTAALLAGACGVAITLFAMVVAMFPPRARRISCSMRRNLTAAPFFSSRQDGPFAGAQK